MFKMDYYDDSGVRKIFSSDSKEAVIDYAISKYSDWIVLSIYKVNVTGDVEPIWDCLSGDDLQSSK